MKERLPNVFANPIEKEIRSGMDVFNSMKQEREHEVIIDDISVDIKINRIFNAKDFVYKKDVEIELNNGFIRKTIVGKIHNSLLTIENEIIPISEIKDIKKI